MAGSVGRVSAGERRHNYKRSTAVATQASRRAQGTPARPRLGSWDCRCVQGKRRCDHTTPQCCITSPLPDCVGSHHISAGCPWTSFAPTQDSAELLHLGGRTSPSRARRRAARGRCLVVRRSRGRAFLFGQIVFVGSHEKVARQIVTGRAGACMCVRVWCSREGGSTGRGGGRVPTKLYTC